MPFRRRSLGRVRVVPIGMLMFMIMSVRVIIMAVIVLMMRMVVLVGV
jgi:hypothetical protein